MQGVFGLHSARDLLRKLELDHARIKADPVDPFAAYDFVVTAWHLLEWALPGPANASARASLCAANPLLRVCEHLAVGAKHFEPSSSRHTSVAGDDIQGIWGKGMWAPGMWAKGMWAEWIVIQLDGEAAAALGRQVTILSLSDQMLDFWRRELS
jgi:hypothetical protein